MRPLFFKKQSVSHPEIIWSPPQYKVKYPRWTIVHLVEDNSYYMIWDTTKLAFISERAFNSWNRVPVEVSKQSIAGYKTWKRIGFAPGTLVESATDGRRFFISGQLFEEERRLITTHDFYEIAGFNPNLALVVSEDELNFHKEGSKINDIRFI